MLTSYRHLLTHAGVPGLISVNLIVKISTPVLSLALLLAAVDHLGSYAAGGLVLTGHALALALAAPLGGRLADRLGARTALTGYLVAHTAAYVFLLSIQDSQTALVVGAAVALGATTPPGAAVIRSAWPRLVPETSLTAAYSVDSAVNELMFIVGPFLVSLLMLVMPAHGVVAVAGASLLLGTVLLLISKPVRHAPPVPAPDPDPDPAARTRLSRLAGPLTHRPTLLLLILAAVGTFSFGCLRIGTVASATEFGAAPSAGVLMGLLSSGAMVGVLGFGSHTWRITRPRLLVLLSLAEAACMLADAVAPGFLVLAILITVTGLLTGPRDALLPALLTEHAPAAYRTEVFAWLNTFMWGGYGIGTAVAGALTQPHDSGTAAFGAAALVALLGAALAAGATARSRQMSKDPVR